MIFVVVVVGFLVFFSYGIKQNLKFNVLRENEFEYQLNTIDNPNFH